MKKIIITLLSMILIVCTGCQKEIVEEVKEPLYFSEDIRIVSKNLNSIEDLAGKVLCVHDTFDKEYSDYVIEKLTEAGIELTEDNLYWVSSYEAIKPLIDSKSIDAWVVVGNKEDLIGDFREDYNPSDYHTIATYNKPYYEEKVVDTSNYVDYLYNKPFAVMLSGLDMFGQESQRAWKSGRSDANHLIIVNPEKKHILLISFPRDSYITNAYTGYKDKLTHFCQNGPDNSGNSVGLLLDTNIPYYCITSFTWFVYGINALGGVQVEVPMDAYLDMDSNRNVANVQRVPKGNQHLWGEPSLALARNRKYNNIAGGDYGRIRNQALLVNSIINKIMTYPDILEMVGMDWLWDYLCDNNFTQQEKNTILALAKKFENDYTIDNYFMENVGGMTDYGASVGYVTDKSIEIAKGKIKLTMDGTVDQDNPYFEDIVLGYVTGGAGTYDDGYIGTEYDLKEKFNITVAKQEEATESSVETEIN